MKRSLQNSVQQRIDANQRRVEESRQREEREREAIRALQEQTAPAVRLLSKTDFTPMDFYNDWEDSPESGRKVLRQHYGRITTTVVGRTRRWVLKDESLAALRRDNLTPDFGGDCYCRACGIDIARSIERVSFQFQWDATSKVCQGFLHEHDCTQVIAV